MPKPGFLDVDPRTMHVPPSWLSGADPYELHQRLARFGAATTGMPASWVRLPTIGDLIP
jgi:hypothetical protein